MSNILCNEYRGLGETKLGAELMIFNLRFGLLVNSAICRVDQYPRLRSSSVGEGKSMNYAIFCGAGGKGNKGFSIDHKHFC